MKKMFFMVAMAAATVAASAQTWIGGEVGYNFEKEKDAEDGINTLVIAPEVGYDLNETWSVAAALNFKHANEGDNKMNQFTIEPYARYKFASFDNVTFFVDGGFGVGFGKQELGGVETKANSFNVGLKPGLAYGFCEKAGLVAHFGFLGYQFDKVGDSKTNTYGFDFANNLTFGIYFNL